MNYLSGAINYIAGADSGNTAASTVPRLVDRIASSALPHDRRAAIIELIAVAATSHAHQLDIGERAIKVLYAVLEQDKEFDDTLRAVLDLLIHLCQQVPPDTAHDALAETRPQSTASAQAAGDASNGTGNSLPDGTHPHQGAGQGNSSEARARDPEQQRALDASADAAATNTDAFLGLPNAMSMLLDLLSHDDLHIRLSTIELLAAMTANSRLTVQAAALEAPEGVARLADLLDSRNPLVRGNATLLLSALAEGSPEICKIVSFSGALDTLFRIIEKSTSVSLPAGKATNVASSPLQQDRDDPDALESAITVRDAMLLVSNLLDGSSATQSFMRDSGCIPKLGAVLSFAAENSALDPRGLLYESTLKAGPELSIARQHFANTMLCLECVRFLVRGNSIEANRNRTICASHGIFDAVLQLCFAVAVSGGVSPERSMIRVNAMLTAAGLIQGHEECLGTFTSNMSVLANNRASPRAAQIVTVEAVMSEHSPAVRAAAYKLLCTSLVADTTLNLPSTMLLNALVAGANNSRTASVGVPLDASGVSTVAMVASTLKSAIVNWPGESDAAGVFYACCAIGWVALRMRGARERLLGAHYDGTGDSLLSRAVRTLGQAERENASSAVRIGLLRLLCTWLYQSPSVVSAFLSSAMHLPLLTELITKSPARGDSSATHSQGLAALLFGICLECAEVDQASMSSEGGFISGGGGASNVMPQVKLAEIVRNRIGATTFTAKLDELKSTRAYISASKKSLDDATPAQMAARENAHKLPVVRGELGHELWYDEDFVSIVDDVYGKVSRRVLDLVTEGGVPGSSGGSQRYTSAGHAQNQSTAVAQSTESALQNGASGMLGAQGGFVSTAMDMHDSRRAPLLESSSRDEVLVSYKDLIRSQDISLNEARGEIEELQAALREIQTELDLKNRASSEVGGRAEREKLTNMNVELNETVAALEALLKQKDADFTALSDAYGALEAEQATLDADVDSQLHQATEIELQRLRAEQARTVSQLADECDKVARLQSVKSGLELSERSLKAQLEAVQRERDTLRHGLSEPRSSLGELAEWRRRAESSEQQIVVHSQVMKDRESEMDELRAVSRDMTMRAEAVASELASATSTVQDLKGQLAQSEATRRRETAMARESSSAAAEASKIELEGLRNEVEKLRKEAAEAVSNASNGMSLTEAAAIRRELDGTRRRADGLDAQLSDMRNSVEEWKSRAEAASLEAKNERNEAERLVRLSQQVESVTGGRVQELECSAEDMGRKLNAAEERAAGLEEVRSRLNEELQALKEEVATRSEQTIRLSGQVYEAGEAREEAESRLKAVSAELDELRKMSTSGGVDHTPSSSESRRAEDEEYIASLNDTIIALKAQVAAAEDALKSATDKQLRANAMLAERNNAVAHLEAAEAKAASAEGARASLGAEVERLQSKLLSLEEAEDAKRRLTMQVGVLQQELASAQAERDQLAGKSHDEHQVESTQVSTLRMELETVKAQLGQAREECCQGEKARVEQANKHDKKLNESASLVAELNAVKQKQQDRILELEQLVEKALTDKATLAEQVTVLDSRVEELQASIADSSNQASELEQLEGKLQSLTKSLDISRADAEAANSRCEEISKARKEHIEALDMLQSTKQGLEVNLKTKEGEYDSVKAQYADLLVQKQAVEAELLEAKETAKKEADLKSESSAANEAAKVLLSNVTSAKDKAVEELAAQRKLTEETLSKTMQLEADVAAKSTRLNRVITEKDALDEKLAILSGTADGAQKEVEELKLALSDAAKSHKTLEKDLLSREELLVEISRDKSTITSSLESANVTIEELRGHICDLEASATGSRVPQAHVIALEAEVAQLRGELASASAVSDTAADCGDLDNVSLQIPKHVLATTNQLVSDIDKNLGELERKHQDLKQARDANASRAEQLETELKTTSKKLADATRLVDTRNASIDSDLQTALGRVQHLENKLDALRESSTAELEVAKHGIAAGKEAMAEKENTIRSTKRELEKLEQSVSSITLQYEEAKVECAKLENDLKEVRSKSSAVELEVCKIREDYEAARDDVVRVSAEKEALKSSSRQVQERLSDVLKHIETLTLSHETEKREMQGKLDEKIKVLASARADAAAFKSEAESAASVARRRIEDLESEMESTSDSLDIAEKRLRDASLAAKNVKAESEKEGKAKKELVAKLKLTLDEEKSKHREAVEDHSKMQASLQENIQNAEAQVSALESDLNASRAEILSLRDVLFGTQQKLAKTENTSSESQTHVVRLKEELGVALSSNATLQQTLEARSAEVSSGEARNAELLESVQRVENELSEVRRAHKSERESSGLLSAQVSRLEGDLSELRQIRATLEDDIDGLQAALDGAEQERDATEKDNDDLRAWVNDLEEKSLGLQTMVENFDELEQSLEDAVNSHAEAVQHNLELSAEVSKLRTELEDAVAESKTAVANRVSAERAQDLSRKQVEELERRLDDIRSTHLTKLSVTEDTMRSNASRVATLEAALAAAERQVAESASLTDKVFGLETNLARVTAESKANMSRAEAAEADVSSMHREAVRLEKDLEIARSSAGGEAYAALEAEHNELLVCLADLEVQCTMLKESDGGAGTARTNESLSVR